MSGKINAKTVSFVVLAAAIAVSGYLSYHKITQVPVVCVHNGPFDCGTVLNSAYSELLGVPVAWLGLATNLIVVGLLLFKDRVEFLQDYGVPLIFGVVLFAFLFSVYLVYVQAFVILAYCPWCLSHEALIAVLFVIWARELWKAFTQPEPEPVRAGTL